VTTDQPPSTEWRRLEAVVLGRVQGVGFRFHVARAAARHRIVGWVANEPSGAVRAIGEGTEADLRDWLAELWAGPSGSSVSRVDEVWSAPTNRFDDFEIRAGWNSGG
jgi:acylphosphatase